MRTDFQYVTVVFKVNEHSAFEPYWDEMHKLFKADDDAPYSITAMSLDDEISRKDAMVHAAVSVDDHYDMREAIMELDSAPSVREACAALYADYPGPRL